MKKYWHYNRNQKGNDFFLRSIKTENKYGKLYNDLREKKDAHTAVSILSRNRIELDRITQNLKNEISDITGKIERKIAVPDEKDYELFKASKTIQLSLSHTFSFPDFKDLYGNDNELFLSFYNAYEVETEELQGEINRYWKLSGETGYNWLIDEIKKAYSAKEKLGDLLLHKRAIEITIAKVLFENYPSNIQLKINPNREKINKERRGRPSEADQEEIRLYVETLIRKGLRKEDGYSKYWHHEKKYKGTPNKNQLAKAVKERGLSGELSLRQIKRRVTQVINEMTL